ncbi:Fanconi anaemia protein FANCD2 [Radiomyces spectabilis]|uniref:Fanconi anaemia protein FANCD2 n=1 Tax=Radiomyces spectabilis TaxID=64574 RepID=UPI00221FA327|nr:Fanconi anaemia protein FANCD2 [Radiomyces spectabilis]KAI8384780.1 Fanconi anaemia protein FANCD2 [Radiomyces spectabilis]
MLLHNCSEYPVCLALVYDELAHIFENTNLDQRLQLWIKESWMVDFTDQYVSDMDELNELVTVMARKQNVFLKPGLWMNLDGEDAQIAMKMYELVLMDDEKKRRSLVVPLCSIFKLIQSCEKKLNNGGLEEIDALLGCGIILFNQETEEEMIRSLDPRELENVCDLLFYTINWFRELLNAFSTLSDDEVHQKLCLRLKNILALETMLQSFITYVPHYLPLEMHSSLSFKESKEMTGVSFPKADPRSSTQVDADASDGEEGTPRPSTKKDTSIRSSTGRLPKLAELKRHMRAFNISVLSLLQVNDAGDANGDAENKLDYACINYLLSDLNEKLDIKVVPAPVHFFGKKKMTNNKKHSVYNALLLARMDAPAFIKQIIQYVPFMLQRLEMLYEDLQLQVYSGRINQSEALAHCVAYIFDILLKMLSWPEIENPENRDVLHALVNAIAERIMMESVHQPSFQKIVVEAFQYLCRFGENMPQAQTAVVLFKLLERLRELSGDIVELSSGGHKVVQGILSTDWFDWRNIKKDIPFLIERSIALSDDPAAVLYNYTTEILPEFERQGGFEQYPLLRTETLVDYYQAIINQTIHLLRTLHENPVDPELMLTQNARIVTVFERTIHCIKTKEERSLFGVLLRTARSFIDEFSKHSIPFFTSIFKTYREPIVGIFKDFQTSTRMLQVICSHVKALKDSQLSSYVPMLKKALETVIFQVKMLLTENNAPADAFFLGALKHRDIRGAEISSQLPREETSESEIEEDQLAEEDSSATTPAESRPSKPAPAKRRKRPTKESPNLPDIRTTSQVPSSSDEDEQDGFPVMPDDILDDDKEEEVEMIRAAKRPIEIIEDDDDEEEVIEFDLDDENDEEAEKEASPAPVSSVESASRNTSKVVPSNPIKRPRLGLGRPNQRSNRVFNLSRRPSSNSDDE